MPQCAGWWLWVPAFAGTTREIVPLTSSAVGIDGAAPIRCTQIDAAALA